jgi:hypothetical protein
MQKNQQAVIARVQQMTSSVQLIETLGGWNVDQLPSERQVAAKRH